MKDHSGCERCFSHTSEAWYAEAALKHEEKDYIMIGFYHPEGGTTGEFQVSWLEVGGKLVPKLEAFDDSWHALFQFGDLLESMADLDNQNVTPHEFVELLKLLGIKDITKRERP